MDIKIITYSLIVFLLVSCGGGGGRGTTTSQPHVDQEPNAKGTSIYPGTVYTPTEAIYDVEVVENYRLKMSDGVELKLDLYFPANAVSGKRLSGPFPVLVTQDPYEGGIRTLTVASPDYEAPAMFFAKRGYIFVELNVRGNGGTLGVNGSEGDAELFDERSSLDGLEVAYWAADPKNLPETNGKIGLQGCSALGISQLASLNQLGKLLANNGSIYVPSELGDRQGNYVTVTYENNPIKAAVPNCLNGDFYRDTFFDGGILGATWELFPAGPVLSGFNTSNYPANLRANEIMLETFSGGDMSFDRQWYKQRNWIRQADDIARTGVPLLMWTGWNEPGGIGGYQLYAALQNAVAGRLIHLPMAINQKADPKYQLLVGEWAHGGGLDLGIELEWFDTWIAGVDTGLREADEPMHIRENTSGAPARWINMTSYPITNEYTPLYLASDGELSSTVPSENGSASLLWLTDLPNLDLSAHTFTISQAFDEDMTLAGPAGVRIWASSTNTNLQLFAQLRDLAPDGSVTPIAHGSVLGSRLKIDQERSWRDKKGNPIQPYLILDDDLYLQSNKPVKLEFAIQPQVWRLPAGHKLQLFLASQMPKDQCFSSILGRPGACLWSKPMLDTLPGVYTVYFGPQTPALVNVPLLPSKSINTIRSGTTPTSDGVVLPLDWGTE